MSVAFKYHFGHLLDATVTADGDVSPTFSDVMINECQVEDGGFSTPDVDA